MSSQDSINSIVVAPSEGRHTHSLREYKPMRFDRRRRDKSAVEVEVHQRCTRRLRMLRKHGIRALLRIPSWHVELPDLAPRTPKDTSMSHEVSTTTEQPLLADDGGLGRMRERPGKPSTGRVVTET